MKKAPWRGRFAVARWPDGLTEGGELAELRARFDATHTRWPLGPATRRRGGRRPGAGRVGSPSRAEVRMGRMVIETTEQACALADILLAAAHSDHVYEEVEARTIEAAVREAMGREELPAQVAKHIADRDAGLIDVEAAVDALGLQGLTQRRALLCAVLRVLDADGVVVDEEDAFLEEVADMLDLPPEELMVIEYEL
ncbi:MAG: TerB family tellurite resistance protein [Deltaproteobacteria bacterium]|nr:TerB family tellurite resistance protein [Deltaproteobacteria bacterium]